MSLLTRIKTWLNKGKPAAHQPVAGRKRPVVSHPHSDPHPQPDAFTPPATGVVDTRVQVRVFYQDASTHANLHPSATLYGHTGEPLPITWQVIAGFVLTEIKNFTQVFPAGNQVIWCGYTARVAGPVIVYHRDSHERLMQVPEIIQGVLNQPYTAAALAEFEDQVLGPATQHGTFTEAAQTLRFSYQLTTLVAGTPPQDAYIRLATAKYTYPDPLAGAPYQDRLPANTYWRVFAVMRDTSTQTVWFNLGGNQWLTADDTQGIENNPYLPDPTPLALPHSLFACDEQPATLHGTVIGAATCFDAPFGNVYAERIQEGTLVTVVAVATLANQSRWYRLADGRYLLAVFVATN